MEKMVKEELSKLEKLEPELKIRLLEELQNDLNGPMVGYVYLMKYSTGFYALGFAVDPTLRRNQLEENEPDNITVEFIHAIPTDDMARLEKETIEIFDKHSQFIGSKIWDLTQNDVSLFCSVKEGYYMRGYVYVIYVGDNQYKIGKTAYLEQRFNQLKEERLVRLIKAENIDRVEKHLHKKFWNKRVTASQELFKLNDQDILYIQMLDDEWEDESRIF